MKNKFIKMSEAQHFMFYGCKPTDRYRFFSKGRRLGASHAAAINIIDRCLKGQACLWGDVLYSNVDRYFQRLFYPFLKAHKIPYKYNQQKKLLQFDNGYCDFRSCDNPMTWEGFGYDFIFLNESGIILDDPYLYLNAILPMMLDNPKSILCAAGTPKILNGTGMLFYELYQKGVNGEEGYFSKTYSTYDNPFLTIDAIQALERSIPAFERDQEVHGKFILEGGSVVQLEWFQRFKTKPAHVDRIIQSWDTSSKDKELNDPSACTTWLESNGYYYLIDVLCDKLLYPDLKRTVWSMAEKFRPDVILVEDKSSGIALIQDMSNDRFPFNILPINPVNDKITRMSTASLTIEAGRVYLPEHAPWLPEYEKEITVFPNKNEHDDRVDSTSQFLNWVKEPSEIFIG